MSEALEILKSCDAFLEGHFLLSSGRHSSAYCQMAYLQQYPDRCAEVMKTVADKVKEMDVDVIVGPAMGGIVYAYELARQTGKRAIFTERVDNVMTLKRFAIHPGEKCLIAEDVVTTGISSLETKRVIEENTIHWVDAKTAVKIKIRNYDYLMIENEEGQQILNPDSLNETWGYAEPSVMEAQPGERFQFFRHGYYIADTKLTNENEKVFNKIVGLKSSWKK